MSAPQSGPAGRRAPRATGPRVVWRKQIGQGLSGPVVAGQRLILFHRVENREIVESLDAATGDLVRTGPSGTNVGDLQVLLAGPA